MKTYTCDKPMAAKRGKANCTESEKCKTCHCCIIDDGMSRYHYSTAPDQRFLKTTRRKSTKGVKKWTDEETTIMLGMFEDGLHYKKIAEKMDRSEYAVYSRLKRLGKLERQRRTVKGG